MTQNFVKLSNSCDTVFCKTIGNICDADGFVKPEYPYCKGLEREYSIPQIIQINLLCKKGQKKQKKSVKGRQTKGIAVDAITNRFEESVIIGSSIGMIVGLFLLKTVVAAPSTSASNVLTYIVSKRNTDGLICETDPKPEYLDCKNILRCINAGEQEIMGECVKQYPADNESRSCNSQDLLYRSWCDYTRGAIPK